MVTGLHTLDFSFTRGGVSYTSYTFTIQGFTPHKALPRRGDALPTPHWRIRAIGRMDVPCGHVSYEDAPYEDAPYMKMRHMRILHI